jgi:hypothetical protein
MEKRQTLHQMLLGKLDIYMQKTKTRPMFVTSINSKWIRDLNIRPKTLKLVQERVKNTLEAIGMGKDFLSRAQAAQRLRKMIDKWDYMKLKSFCTTKEMVSKQNGRKSFPAIHLTRGLVTRIYRELKKLNSQ